MLVAPQTSAVLPRPRDASQDGLAMAAISRRCCPKFRRLAGRLHIHSSAQDMVVHSYNIYYLVSYSIVRSMPCSRIEFRSDIFRSVSAA